MAVYSLTDRWWSEQVLMERGSLTLADNYNLPLNTIQQFVHSISLSGQIHQEIFTTCSSGVSLYLCFTPKI